MSDAAALLRLEIATCWLIGDGGRLVRSRTPEWRPVPVLTVGGGAGALCLRGMMPERDRTSLLGPWTVAVVDGQVAAVCETARSAPRSVEAGVRTYEPYRRQGLAAAATSAWATQVSGRTAFYSTSAGNLASQGVARRLGLHPLGQWWTVYRA